MFLLQITMAPITVQFGERLLSIPKVSFQDIVSWASEIEKDSITSLTEGMDDLQRREYLTIYPPVSPSMDQMRRWVRTPAGIEKVLRHCLPKASVTAKDGSSLPALTEPEIAGIINNASPATLELLSWNLADLIDTSRITQPKDTNNQEDKVDPSKRREKELSKESVTTGQTTSQSSTPPTHN